MLPLVFREMSSFLSARVRLQAFLNRTFHRQPARQLQSGRRARLGLEPLESRDLPSLVIVPTFASNITSDPNAAAIESTINTAIQNIEAAITTSITVDITFQEISSGLGQSSFSFYTVSYSSYRSALASHATSAADMSALASLPTGSTNPVNGNSSINIQAANADALGIVRATAMGTVSLNTSICNLTRTNINPNDYDLLAVAAHEIDEVLAFGSALNGSTNGAAAPTGPVWGDDLFRYSAPAVRSFDTNAGTDAYFSIDGGNTDLARFNQQQGGDLSDWYSVSGANPPRVQDAYATAGATPNLGVELTRLDVLGYTLSPTGLVHSTNSNFVVTDLSDSSTDPGSIRYVLNEVNGDLSSVPDTITFAAGLSGTISLIHGSLTLSRTSGPVIISGGGQITISGSDASQIFSVGSGVTATISGLSIIDGRPPPRSTSANGGGIVNSGVLTVTNCTFSADSAQAGGAIYNQGTLTISGSTFTGNSTSVGGGGAIENVAVLSASDCTFSGNTAATNGGAIDNNTGTLALTSCTITGNFASANNGGGIAVDAGSTSASLLNSIVAGNFVTGSGTLNDISGSLNAGESTYNLIGAGGAGGLTIQLNNNQVGVSVANAGLAALGNYGGTTQTFALLSGSAAIGAGTNSLTTLASNVTSSTTPTLSVADATFLGVGEVILIDSEQMQITAISGTTITVVRGFNSTSAANHSAGASVELPADQRGFPRMVGALTGVGAFEQSIPNAPILSSDPANQAITLGQIATFTAAATGSPTPTVQWQVNTGSGFVNLSDGGVYSGSSTTTLTITGATTSMNRYLYQAVFTNSNGTAVTTSATLTFDAITTQPSNQTVNAGQNASFTAMTSNPTGTDLVQWQVNTGNGFVNLSDGGVYSGVTTTTLTITGATAAMSGYQYDAVFTNNAGSLTTSAATLTVIVTTTTSITPNPVGPLTPNEPVSFMATITGSPSVGTITFYAGPGLTNEIGSPVSVSGGTATSAPDTSLSAGAYTITAVYSGGTGFTSSQGTLSITVNGLPTLAGLPVVNGSNAAINIVSASGDGTTATITTDGTSHGFWVGELVTLTGVTPGGPGGLAGTVTVTGVPSATTFQFASTYNGSETLSGATVTAALAGAQRSMVDSIVYNFTEPVTLTAAAFSINVDVNNTSNGSDVGVQPTLNVAPVPFTNEWVVTFTDPVNGSVIGNSIANGAYSITINPAYVTAVSGGQNLSAGETDTFYRLYGDVTGVQSVKNVDANAFNRAWGNAYYSANYNAALDYNDDGKYTNIDANAFNRAFNTRYSVVTTI